MEGMIDPSQLAAYIAKIRVYQGVFGFLVFLFIGWNLISGYALIKKILSAFEKSESIDEHVEKIKMRSRLASGALSLQDLSVFAFVSFYLSELEKMKYTYTAIYLLFFFLVFSVPGFFYVFMGGIIGASLASLVVLYFRLSALSKFFSVFASPSFYKVSEG